EHALAGINANEIFDGQRRTAVNVRLEESARRDVESLDNLLVDTPTGAKVPLHSVAKVYQTTGPNAINHENGRRRIAVMANTQGRDLGSVVDDVKHVLDTQVKLPTGYYITIGGQFESQQSATRAIAALSIFALAGVF